MEFVNFKNMYKHTNIIYGTQPKSCIACQTLSHFNNAIGTEVALTANYP